MKSVRLTSTRNIENIRKMSTKNLRKTSEKPLETENLSRKSVRLTSTRNIENIRKMSTKNLRKTSEKPLETENLSRISLWSTYFVYVRTPKTRCFPEVFQRFLVLGFWSTFFVYFRCKRRSNIPTKPFPEKGGFYWVIFCIITDRLQPAF